MTYLHILTYASVAVFVVAIVVRAVRLATTPVHLRWELYPVAHEKDRVRYGGSYFEELDWWTKKREKSMLGELKVMIPEILLQKGLWENNRSMWLWSLLMHNGLYLVIGFAGLAIIGALAGTATEFGSLIKQVAYIVGLIGYIIGVIGTAGLFVLRIGSYRLRSFSPPVAYFNLLFLLALFATGTYLFAVGNEPVDAIAGFAHELITFSPNAVPAGIGGLHLTIAMLFVLYLPFTHMTHFFTKYFTYHAVRWNDEPNLPGSKLEKAIQRQLGYPVSWAAPHLKADGKKNWADIALDTGEDK